MGINENNWYKEYLEKPFAVKDIVRIRDPKNPYKTLKGDIYLLKNGYAAVCVAPKHPPRDINEEPTIITVPIFTLMKLEPEDLM